MSGRLGSICLLNHIPSEGVPAIHIIARRKDANCESGWCNNSDECFSLL